MSVRIVVTPRPQQSMAPEVLDTLVDRLADAKTLAEVRTAATEAKTRRRPPAKPT